MSAHKHGDGGWWESKTEVARVATMLALAGVLRTPELLKDFTEKPWKWTRVRKTCEALEGVMRDAGIVPTRQAWEDTTFADVAEKVGRVRPKATVEIIPAPPPAVR